MFVADWVTIKFNARERGPSNIYCPKMWENAFFRSQVERTFGGRGVSGSLELC